MFVTCDFIGRLGNQCWQIAATLGYAKKYNVRFGFPSHTLSPKLWPLYFKQLPFNGKHFKKHKEPEDMGYKEIPFYPNGICLHGFFQSYKYFNAEDLGLLRAKTSPIDFVSVHVRRGDYLEHRDAFPPQPKEYFEDAISYFKAREHTKFMFFSDDIPWCKENFPNHYFSTSGPSIGMSANKALEDFHMMQSCEHHIISNSSYSWWGAYLGRNDKKIIICPKQWYGPANSHINIETLIPESWMKA